MKLSKDGFYKKCGPKLIFVNEKKIRKIDIENPNFIRIFDGTVPSLHEWYQKYILQRLIFFGKDESCVKCGTHATTLIWLPVGWLNRNMKHTVTIIDFLLFFDRLHHKLAAVIWIWPLFKLLINPVFVYWSFWEKEKIRNVFWLPIRSVIQAEIMKLEMKRVYLTKAIFWAKVCTYFNF